MTYSQVRGRASSLSPKSRPKIPLSAQSALCLRRNPLPAARTVRKTHRFLYGGRVPQDGQAGAAIGCSVSDTVFSHGTPSLCTHGLRPLLSTFPTPNSDSLFLVDLTAKNGTKANNRTMVDFPMKSSCCEGKFSWCGWAQVTRQAGP